MDEKQAEYLKDLARANTPLFPFDVIETKVNLLILDRTILNKHPEDFPEKFRNHLQQRNTEMAENLTFYMVQEIQDFYRQAYVLFKDKINFPETAKEIMDFRGSVIAHIKKKTAGEIADECINMEKNGGFDKIYLEWTQFKENLYKKIKCNELTLPKC